jgi:hypothetical protein
MMPPSVACRHVGSISQVPPVHVSPLQQPPPAHVAWSAPQVAHAPSAQMPEQHSLARVQALALARHIAHLPLSHVRPLQQPPAPSQPSPAALHTVQISLAQVPLQHSENALHPAPPFLQSAGVPGGPPSPPSQKPAARLLVVALAQASSSAAPAIALQPSRPVGGYAGLAQHVSSAVQLEADAAPSGPPPSDAMT